VIQPGKPIRLIFAGGGTGGHLYPAIAIADRIKESLRDSRPVEILFVGTRRGIEYRIKDQLGYPLHLIHMQGLVRSLTWRNLLVPFVVTMALFKSLGLMRQFAPDMVIGTGGYVSWPVLKAATMKQIPTVIQEQNSFPGIATRRLAPKAQAVYLGFEDAKKHLTPTANCILTGNPVRTTLAGADRAEALRTFKLDPSKKTILVFGGSQGAHAINEAVLVGLGAKKLPANYQLLWLTGKRDYTDVNARAGDMAASHALFPYEHRMNLVYAASDVAIARAGALTLAELEMCALPSILVPYLHAAGDHQRKNAQSYAAAEFGEVIDESELAGVDLLSRAVELVESGRSSRMRQAMIDHKLSHKAAVDLIAEDILARLHITPATRPRSTQEQYGNA
jgi:UDP-N-acetylglucosamine--N-acetylmuramyl-(pentapeptide) pyrophosphoryl-undecaprenol N-acetylglucosamine transferase